MDLIETLKHEEGFSGVPYIDTEGFETIGFGTKLPISAEEAETILVSRFNKFKLEIQASLKHLNIEDEAWDVLYLMAYQLGVNGLLKFKKMINALESQNYYQASLEMADSQWKRQTPERAKRLITKMQGL